MDDQQPIEIRVSDTVDGVDVTPDAVPISLLREFSRDVEEFLRGSESLPEGEGIIVQIRTGSLSIQPRNHVSDRLRHDVAMLGMVRNVADIDPKRASVILRWQKAAKAHPSRKYVLADTSRGHTVAITSSTSYFEAAKEGWVAVNRRILGEVVDMGGAKKVNVQIRTRDGILVVESDAGLLAKEKENRLYKKVLITIKAEENVHTGELRNKQLIRFEDYEPAIRKDLTDALHERGRQAWADVDAVEWTRKLRGN